MNYGPSLSTLLFTAMVSTGMCQSVNQEHLVQQTIASALMEHKDGQTSTAISILENFLKAASSEDSIQPMLRLGYLYMAAKNKDAARERFKRIAQLPKGLDDSARGEAALRIAYLSNGFERGVWSERIVAGDYTVTPQQLADAYRLAAGAAHQRRDLQRAIELYQETPEMNETNSNKSYIYKELAGLYFEVAKGEGKDPIAETVRPQMFAQSRSLCREVENMSDAPDNHRMVAELMYAETWLFEDNYQKSYEECTKFL